MCLGLPFANGVWVLVMVFGFWLFQIEYKLRFVRCCPYGKWPHGLRTAFRIGIAHFFSVEISILPLRNAQKVSQNTKRTRWEAWKLDSALLNSQCWSLDHPWPRTLHLVEWEWLSQEMIFHTRCYCHLVAILVDGLKRAQNIAWAWFFRPPSLHTQFGMRT